MIKNRTKKIVVSSNTVYLEGVFEKSTGFIKKSGFEAVIFNTRFGIHTFGLKFPIDVLILDKDYKVVAMRKNLKPNRIFIWNPKYKLVVEVNKKLVKNDNTSINDYLDLNL